ncbi:Acyl-CoA oxidase/dehydrogenase, type 1 [Penicillium expansum]|uniref:Acyl-CoA oxidase/dehydrogenase, type 1 n=1 Tax=Penicillium expansum TaxID=27334 RepID=A0A0A2K400_PENEN|nr:Acyl-CoA oxidase/dehydrogenase, type 1 [Penicillium expansum]KGO38527.1 Acyl-CoA oxidase/dehydrogenase, type 1 [Penicillium expansum]KGO61771.1 Acyl-CoA oxidase/dehydrogenase, type 1 [Penicillium expansum]
MSTPQPATADSGYITDPGPLMNTYTSDPSLQRTLAWYLPSTTLQSVQPHLTQFGAEAISEQVREWSADAERNVPYVKSHNVWGKRYDYDRLVTTEGWKQLGKWGARNRIVSAGYDQHLGVDRRTVQYAFMTDGAAFILSSRINKLPSTHPFHTAFQGLISEKDDHWTSGQWMTERTGGSDVQNTETWATYSPLATPGFDPLGDGDYLVSGFKFFSSATDANLALLLAKTPSGKLSTFLAPLRRTVVGADGVSKVVSNGVRIHRLKNKLGTKELPTAELELKDMRAHLLGELDQGIVTIAPLLNVTRLHTFVGSLAGWRRAVSITKSFAKARTTVGEPLWLIPMHLRLLADLEVKHRGAMNLAWFTVALFGVVENQTPSSNNLAHLPQPGKEAEVVFRTLTATAKAVISKMATVGIQECQESMGGVGYMDEADEPEFNISRILRNNAVNSIWEGTTNVLASEFVRFLIKKDNLKIFGAWLDRTLTLIQSADLQNALTAAWSALRARFTTQDPASTVADGRRFMFTLAWILSGALLALDAERDNDPVATEIARRWILSAEGGVGEHVFHDIVTVSGTASASSGGEKHLQWDCRIAWGIDLPPNRASGHRSLQKASSKL